jgi:hypothetical protein
MTGSERLPHFFAEALEGSRSLTESESRDLRDSQLLSVYYMLSGYALENLLKGAIMLGHPEYFKADGKLAEIRSHNLAHLWRKAGLALVPAEEVLLDKLSRYVDWLGRYPVPLAADKILPLPRKDGTWDHQAEPFKGRQTQETINRLYTKAHDEFSRQEEIRDERRKH